MNNRISEFRIHIIEYSTRIKKLQNEWTSYTQHWAKEAKHRVRSIWVHLHTTNRKNYTVWNQDDGYEGYKEGFGNIGNVLFNHQSFGHLLCSVHKNSSSYTVIICILFYIYTGNSIKKF